MSKTMRQQLLQSVSGPHERMWFVLYVSHKKLLPQPLYFTSSVKARVIY